MAKSEFTFETVNQQVKIVPMGTLFCQRVMDRFRKAMKGVIVPNNCFINALIAAQWFQEQGFDVEVAEGTYEYNEYAPTISQKYGLNLYSKRHQYMNEGPQDHRFCRKGDKYFDPTLELCFGYEWTKGFDYTVCRVYSAKELISYAITIGNTFNEKPHFCSSISGRTYAYVGDEDVPIQWGIIDNDGLYIPPADNPFARLTQLTFAQA